MNIFWIITNHEVGERPFQFPLEADFASVEAIADHLDAGKMLVGTKLDTRSVGPFEAIVTGREPIALSTEQVGIVQPWRRRVVGK
jgi:hypothetical protein